MHQSHRRPFALSVRLDRARRGGGDERHRTFVDYDEDIDFSAIELIRIKHYVSDLLRSDADVTTGAGLHPLIRDDVVASAEKIF